MVHLTTQMIALQETLQIEARSPDQDGQVLAFRNFLNFLLGLLDKFKGRIALVNRPDIYQVMGCLSLFQLIDLGCPDREFLIDLLTIP